MYMHKISINLTKKNIMRYRLNKEIPLSSLQFYINGFIHSCVQSNCI